MSETNETIEVSALTDSAGVLGTLESAEQEKLNSLRQNAQMLVGEIGQIEVRKARLLGALSEIEAKAQEELSVIGKRLGVPEGKPWQVGADGQATLVAQGSAQA